MTSQLQGYKDLMEAIVIQACNDYYIACNKGRSGARTKGEIRKFFRSELFNTYCDIDPEELISKIESRARNNHLLNSMA